VRASGILSAVEANTPRLDLGDEADTR
jgi:hypothetical protein